MRSLLLFAVLLAAAAAVPNGYYHQEYNYRTSSSSYKNNELQQSNDDEGHYSKDGDLEGRLRPRVNSHNQHSEYVNPKLQHAYRMGPDRSSSLGQLHAHNQLGLGGAYSDYGMSSDLRQVTTSLQEEMQRELQRAVFEQYQRAAAYGSVSQAQIEADRRLLEEELRRNVTMRLQDALKMHYGNQGVRGAYSYSIVNGRLQPTANYDNRELEDLTRQLEGELMRHLNQQLQSQYHTRVDTQLHTQRNTYRTVNGADSYPSPLQQGAPVYQPYPQPLMAPQTHPVAPIPDSITTVATRVQTELNEILNKLLEDTQRRYFSENSYHSGVDYNVVLSQLQQELRRNITFHLDDQIKRAYGYSNYASRYSPEDIENLRRQIEGNLLTKLNRDFSRQRDKYLQTRSYVVHQPMHVVQEPMHVVQQPMHVVQPPMQNVYYPINNVNYNQDISDMQRRLQEQLSRQLQTALMQQSYRQAHSYTGSNFNPQANYQNVLNQLTMELNRNLTRQMEQLNAEQYQGAQLAEMRNQLEQDLTRQLQQGLQQSFSRYSSWSSSSSSSSQGSYRPVKGYMYGGVQGGSLDLGEGDCMMGDDPSIHHHRKVRSYDLTQQTQDDDDLTQQTQDDDDLTQQTQDDDDLTQQSEDLNQQIHHTNDFLNNERQPYRHGYSSRPGYGDINDYEVQGLQSSQDLTQQVQTHDDLTQPATTHDDLTQQVQTGDDLTQVQSEDLTHDDLTQQVQTHDDLTQQVQTHDDLTQQVQSDDDLTQVQSEDLTQHGKTHDDLTQQVQTHDDLTQQVQSDDDLTQQVLTEDLTQQVQSHDDLTEQTQNENLTQQVENSHDSGIGQFNYSPKPVYADIDGHQVQVGTTRRGQANQQIQSHDLTQQVQSEDLTQQTEDLTQAQTPQQRTPYQRFEQWNGPTRPHQGPTNDDLTQQVQTDDDLTQHPQGDDLTQQLQTDDDLTQHPESDDLTQVQTDDDVTQRTPSQDLTQAQTDDRWKPRQDQRPYQRLEHWNQPTLTQPAQTHDDLTQQIQTNDDLNQQHQNDDLTQAQTVDSWKPRPPQSPYLRSHQRLEQWTQPTQAQDLTQAQTLDSWTPRKPQSPYSRQYQLVGSQQVQANDYLTQHTQDLTQAQAVDNWKPHQQQRQYQRLEQPVQTQTVQANNDLTQQTQDLTQAQNVDSWAPQQQSPYLRQHLNQPAQTQQLQTNNGLTDQTQIALLNAKYAHQAPIYTRPEQTRPQQTHLYSNPYVYRQNRYPEDNLGNYEMLTPKHSVRQLVQNYEALEREKYMNNPKYRPAQAQEPQSFVPPKQSPSVVQPQRIAPVQSREVYNQQVQPVQLQGLNQQSGQVPNIRSFDQFPALQKPISDNQLQQTQQAQDLTQQTQDLTQQTQDLTQQTQDLTQQTQDLTQQSQNSEFAPLQLSNTYEPGQIDTYGQRNKNDFDLTQQAQLFTNQDLNQQTQNVEPQLSSNQIIREDQQSTGIPNTQRLTDAQQESQRLINLIKNERQRQQENQSTGPQQFKQRPGYSSNSQQPLQHNSPPVYSSNGGSLTPQQPLYGQVAEPETVETTRDIEPIEPQVANTVQQVDGSEVPLEPEVSTQKAGWWSRLGTNIKNKLG